MENDKTLPRKNSTSSKKKDAQDLTVKLQELEIQKEKLEETIKAREEQLLNLFSYIQTSTK